jgi:glycerate 2-kinase
VREPTALARRGACLKLLRAVYCNGAAAQYTSLHPWPMTNAAGATTRALLEQLYAAAVAAAAPDAAVDRALGDLSELDDRPVWLFGLGKAAQPMTAAAVESLRRWGRVPAGGLIVAPAPGPVPHRSLGLAVGDHPEPGARSFAAAEALARAAARVSPGDEAWVLLSGGATSLLGAPVNGIRPEHLTALYSLLLRSGLDITAMNRIRKRFSRWGAGRLALALAPARVRVLVVSDVIGDDLASIASGPCVPDPATAGEVRADLQRADLWVQLPPALRDHLSAAAEGRAPETPKPGDPAFAQVETRLIASNHLALEAAAAQATTLGLAPRLMQPVLSGEAAETGRQVGTTVLSYCRGSGSQPATSPSCLIWGGETTVTFGSGRSGLGGRSQELALAAAEVLAQAQPGTSPAILAGGTDGRDGPTDAAGAIVDGSTWDAIRRNGRDPAEDLSAHNAYPALDAVGALIRPGLTGTNVMDVVFGLA